MDLDKIYLLAQHIEAMILRGELSKDDMKDMGVRVEVTPTHHYGIEKKFHEETNDGSTEGFEPSGEDIHAIINDVPFVIGKKSV